jgi:photosystem II stability/assembly factor-like uncharacterized protein
MLGGLGQDYASAVTADGAGNTYVAGLTYSKDFPVTAGAVQTTFGGTCDAFVAKLGRDGRIVWATFLGGILDDAATGIALDGYGNVIVSGYTRSSNFPVVHAAQPTLNGDPANDAFDAFVAKLDPTGSRLLYSTFLGGPDADMGYGLAVDAAGAAYVAGTVSNSPNGGIFVRKLDASGTPVYAYFHPSGTASAIALDSSGSAYVTGTSQSGQALVLKLAPDGSRPLFETSIGGGAGASGTGIALGRDGSIYLAGLTASVDFPLVHALQNDLGARSLWKTTDGGTTWKPIDHLPFASPQTVVAAPDALYAATGDTGMWKSTDGGVDWSKIDRGIATANLLGLAADPQHAGTLFVSSAAGVLYRTTDGGANWTAVDSMTQASAQQIVLDGQNVYALWGGQARKSADGGKTWTGVVFPGASITFLATDPAAPGSLWADSGFFYGGFFGVTANPYLWHSTDAGATWTQTLSIGPGTQGLLVDPSTQPSTVYNSLLSRSGDGGATWVTLPPGPVTPSNATAIALGPGGAVYAAAFTTGLYVSHDRGQTWTGLGIDSLPAQILQIVPTADPSTIFVVEKNWQTTGFVTKLAADGSTILFSTYLGGHVSFGPQTQYAAEPAGNTWMNGIGGIAIDRAGNVVVGGTTRAADFPLVPGTAACANRGAGDAFAATLSSDGTALVAFECMGGSQDEGVLAVAADPRGGAVFAGQTWSPDWSAGFVSFGDAFVVQMPYSVTRVRRPLASPRSQM